MKKHRGFFGDEVVLRIGVFLEFYPRKSPKIIWGYFGDRVGLKIGFFLSFIPENNFGIFWGFIPDFRGRGRDGDIT